MKARPIKPSDYATACEWWTGRDFPCVPEINIPETGAIVDDFCLGYLFLSNGGLCMVEFVVGNPDKSGIELHNAIAILLKDLLAQAKANGCNIVFSSVKNKSLIKIMERVGFNVTDQDMTNLVYF